MYIYTSLKLTYMTHREFEIIDLLVTQYQRLLLGEITANQTTGASSNSIFNLVY